MALYFKASLGNCHIHARSCAECFVSKGIIWKLLHACALVQMALYLKASYGSSEEFVPRMSPHKFGLLLETLSAAELC
eukprot:scaffold93928_cov23-Tisochrysis_lutea.AAC.1